MTLLMVVLPKKFGPFWEVGGSKSKYGSDEKLEDSEDPKKRIKKRAQERTTKF
jgi:hypothetical protein